MGTPLKNVLIVSSIFLEQHNTISAFIDHLSKIFTRKGHSVKIIFKDKRKKKVAILDLIRHVLWLLGMKGIHIAYYFSLKLNIFIIQNELKRITKENYKLNDAIIISNDIYASNALARYGVNFIQVIHGKYLFEVISENPKILKNRDILRKIVNMERNALASAKKLVIVDKSLEDYLTKIMGMHVTETMKKKMLYLPNPIDDERFTPHDRIISKDIAVLAVILSSSSLGKDYTYLISLLKTLKKKQNKIKNKIIVLVVGNYYYLDKKIIEILNKLSNRNLKVHLLGPVPNSLMPIIYSNSDLILNPLSKLVTSGISRVSLEAMLCKSIPATTPEGNVYPVIDMSTGLILPRNNIERAAEKIIAVLSNSSIQRRLRQEAFRISKKYIEKINDLWYKALIEGS